MNKAYLYKELEEKKVQCRTCGHYCVIGPGERGICGVRENRKGTLYALNYGRPVSISPDPIEKKPLFHFLPGTRTLSFATVGCNFSCANCQNWQISQGPKMKDGAIRGREVPPGEIVDLALEKNLPSISYTYTEPTVFLEYALDTMKLARKQGIKNVWVTNGFLSPETFELISPYLDAANVDLKSFSDDFYKKVCGARLEPVLNTLKRMKSADIWLEITTLVIPTLSNDPEMLRRIALFIKNEIGPETPWHITRFSSSISWRLKELPDTSVQNLTKAYNIGKKSGLKYVYTGNLGQPHTENTLCPNCGTLLIKRSFYNVESSLEQDRCPECGQKIEMIIN